MLFFLFIYFIYIEYGCIRSFSPTNILIHPMVIDWHNLIRTDYISVQYLNIDMHMPNNLLLKIFFSLLKLAHAA